MAGGGAGTRRTATLAARAASGRCRAAVGADRAAARICTCYEAGYEGFWLHRRLVAAGVESVVVDPSSLQVDRRARRKKTDAIDVETILRALVGWDRGERGRCHMVRIPEAAAEDARRCSRERERLIGEQTGHTNRIRGLLMTMGIYDFDPRRRDRRDRLPALVTGDGRALPPGLTIKIGREIERLELVERQIAELERDRTRRGRPAGPAATPPSRPVRRRRSPVCANYAGSGRRSLRCCTTKCCTAGLPTAAKSPLIAVSTRPRLPAATSAASKGSARPATGGRDTPQSNSPGCGCTGSPTLRSRAGSAPASAAPPAASSRS
jgi:hypothetical protein